MTEREIQNALWHWLRQKGHEWMCPNYTPLDWWECDMFSMTKAGRFVEHEIKTSVADFRADKGKEREDYKRDDAGKLVRDGPNFAIRESRGKHASLALGDMRGPVRFRYVVPAEVKEGELRGIITPDECPVWAGLIYVYRASWGAGGTGLSFDERKPAPRLHSNEASPKIIDHLKQIFYWRFWNLRHAGGSIKHDENEAMTV